MRSSRASLRSSSGSSSSVSSLVSPQRFLAARPVKAAIYCRISRDRVEITEGGEKRFTMLGVERQELDCRIKAASLGWEVAETFVDNDISATSGRTRPGYEAMLAAIENG